ncbi:MAG TPA: hypothetical protein VM118_11495 [Acidobacteriota bacterium]|nr:hypothetical protein [Acidobacteriota bacterium]
MRYLAIAIVTATVGLLLLPGGAAEQESSPVRPPGVSAGRHSAEDPASLQQGDSVLPIRMFRTGDPITAAPQVTGLSASEAGDCPPIIEFGVTSSFIAPRFDSVRGVTEIYVSDPVNEQVIRHDIDAALNHTETPIPVNTDIVWIAEDLDRDGEIELVGQDGAYMSFYSSPDWSLRQQFYWLGMSVKMTPTVVNIDDDPYLEIYATLNGSSWRAVIIKYDADADSFAVISDIEATYWTVGPSAVGDFDEDGRMEFISGNFFGYGLFEWQESTLVHIGAVGDFYCPGYCATACRPKPDRRLRALIGCEGGDASFLLLKANGDNTFEVEHTFGVAPVDYGIVWNFAADTDCDGLDELAVEFYPLSEEWHWSMGSGEFSLGCTWDKQEFGMLVSWQAVDLDQNGAWEWGTVSDGDIFRAFAGSQCVNCDSLGFCAFPDPDCYCSCLADPECDGLANVLDVVKAVDVAFRGASAEADPLAQCPYERTDADCSGDTDVLDVVRIVNVAFRSGDPATEYFEPCP